VLPLRIPARVLAACFILFAVIMPHRSSAQVASARVDVTGQVSDSTSRQPLSAADVAIVQNGSLVAHTATDASGRFQFHAIPAGAYRLEGKLLGYRTAHIDVTIGDRTDARFDLVLTPAPIQLQAVEVGAQAPLAVDTRTGDQVFQQSNYHGAPTTTASQILQQSIAGAVRAPTGEVHIRGQHAEYTYYIDGVPVVAGISGGLNELFDPEVTSQIRFETGSWDAEFGNKNAAIVYVATKVPTGRFHLQASDGGGSFGTNDQKVTLSSRSQKFGFFLSGSRQVTDMRQEPVMFHVATLEPINFHNHGEDLFAFGKAQWLPTTHDFVNVDLNLSRTKLQVPFDSTGGGVFDDQQKEINGFENASWQHDFGDGVTPRISLVSAVFQRHGSLDYLPGDADTPQFVFFPNPTPFNLTEERSFQTTGVKADLTGRPSHDLEWKLGVQGAFTSGHENFATTDSAGDAGPVSVSDLKGHDVGAYAQAVLLPLEQIEIRAGVRYDSHLAPFASTQHQASPRFKLSWLPSTATTVWAYYGRLFIPTNVEDLRAITSIADSGVVALPTLPERDHFYEVGVVHRFPQGVVAKLSGYQKHSSPGIDDNTVPGSAIVTSVNLAEVRVTGIEAAI